MASRAGVLFCSLLPLDESWNEIRIKGTIRGIREEFVREWMQVVIQLENQTLNVTDFARTIKIVPVLDC